MQPARRIGQAPRYPTPEGASVSVESKDRRAKTAIRDPATPARSLPALGRAQQRAYRTLVRQPRLVPKVLAQLPPRLRRVVQANCVLAAARLLWGQRRPRRHVRAVSAYASQLRANRRAFLGYYHWQVFYATTLLPEGYPAGPARPAPG